MWIYAYIFQCSLCHCANPFGVEFVSIKHCTKHPIPVHRHTLTTSSYQCML